MFTSLVYSFFALLDVFSYYSFVIIFVYHFFLYFFFFNDTATTEIYTLSLHDALPISSDTLWPGSCPPSPGLDPWRSEEHTSELQSRPHLVCRLLLEKKKNTLLRNQHG